MKRVTIFITVVSLVACLAVLVPAQTIPAQSESLTLDPIDIRIELVENAGASIDLRARLVNTGSIPISNVGIRIESLDVVLQSVTVESLAVDGSVQRLDRFSQVNVPFTSELNVNESVWIEIHAELNDVQVSNGISLDGLSDLWDFIFYVRPAMTYGNFSLTTVLPIDATLSKDSVVPLYPESSTNFTDGQAMGFTWNASLIQAGQSKVFIAKYQLSRVAGTPFENILALVVIAGGIGLAVGLVTASFGPKVAQRIRQIGSVKIAGITSEEEEVLEAIRQKGGSCPQKDLYTSMNLSQSKISLVLTNLEERNLIRRMRDGRENTVHLCED
ncbi:MAG: helix-turn-helix transcriptional regulator [Candidatus Thorarchaeota archaeon]